MGQKLNNNKEAYMEYAEIKPEYRTREAIKNELGGVEIPYSGIGFLQWGELSNDCLLVVLLRKKDDHLGLICSNRIQMKEQISKRNEAGEPGRDFFQVEISRLMKHSNLEFFMNIIEGDRKLARKKRRVPLQTLKALMEDIITKLNRTTTAEDLAALHNTSKMNVMGIATRLVKKNNFIIPGVGQGRGKMFDVLAGQLAENHRNLLAAPLAKKEPTIPNKIHQVEVQVPATKGKGPYSVVTVLEVIRTNPGFNYARIAEAVGVKTTRIYTPVKRLLEKKEIVEQNGGFVVAH